MATTDVWNVFLPVKLLADSPTFLTGHIDESALSVYVTHTRSKSVKVQRDSIIGEFSASEAHSQTRQSHTTSEKSVSSVWLNIVRKSPRNVLESRLYRSGKADPYRCVTILCDPSELLSSFVFAEEDDKCVDTTLTRLLRVYKPSTRGRTRRQKFQNAVNNNCQTRIQQTFLFFLNILIFIFKVIESFLRLITFKWCWSRICILAPSIMNNVTYKLNRFKRIHQLTASKHRSKLILFDICGQQLLDTVLGVSFMLCVMYSGHADIIAAFLMNWADDTAHYLNDLLHWLMGAPAGLKLNAQLTEYMGHFFLYHVYLWSVTETKIMKILTDVPNLRITQRAGEGLNDSIMLANVLLVVRELSSPTRYPETKSGLLLDFKIMILLAKHLWYLSILRPVLGWVIWTAASFGTLGLSTQLCLVQDIISMLTLHIYCFYVYAARLYSLQIYALSSLWRLFRGKKWNVLRLRVDSALYTIDQLCVGTLLFTVLLFLLPTSLLYYSVFTALRLLVLSVHGVLTIVRDALNMIPAVTVLLRVVRSKCVAGDLLFTVLHNTEDQDSNSLTLSMQVTQLPLPKLYRHAQTLMKTESHLQEQQTYSWTELLQRVISGNLVYPWISPVTTDSKEKGL